jgi:hypothetical protein
MKDQSIMHAKPSESEDGRMGSTRSIGSSMSPIKMPLKNPNLHDSRRKAIFRKSTVRDSYVSSAGHKLANLNSIDESLLEGVVADDGELRIATEPARAKNSFKIEPIPI